MRPDLNFAKIGPFSMRKHHDSQYIYGLLLICERLICE